MINLKELIEQTKSLKLLYVEDNQDTRESTLLLLNNLFEDITVAVDGEEGLEKFKNNKIDLVISDINMPNIDGIAMSKIIKQINNSIPIILLTAITNISTIKESIDIGIDSFINKPLEDVDLLFEKLDQIVKKINYDKLKEDKERVQLIFNMIRNISHHWKQPLSVISMISSGYSYKIDNNMELTKKDFANADIITQKAEELADVLKTIEKLDFDTITIKEIEKIIEISNPIEKDSINDTH